MVRSLRSRVNIPMSITRSHTASLPEVPNTIQGRWVVTIPATDLHHDLLEPYSCCQLKNGMKRINVPLSTGSTYINRYAPFEMCEGTFGIKFIWAPRNLQSKYCEISWAMHEVQMHYNAVILGETLWFYHNFKPYTSSKNHTGLMKQPRLSA